MTAVALTDRRARLKLVVSEPAETATIEHILRKRLRERRERRGALDRRQAEREKRAGWIAAEDVLKGMGNPNDLMKALRSGAVACLFIHPPRWWLKPSTVPQTAWEGAQFKSDGKLWRNGVCLEGHQQQLVINEQQWGQYSGKPAAPASSADVTSIMTGTATDPVEPSPSMPPAETPALSSAPSPQAEQQLPPPQTRTTKRTTIEEYAAFQNDYLKTYGVYASKKAERNWAKAKGCSAQHVRDELRPQYRDGLQPAERTKFQSHSKKAQPPDDGR